MKPRIVFWAIFLGLCGFYVGIPPFHYTSMDAHPDEHFFGGVMGVGIGIPAGMLFERLFGRKPK